MSRIGKKPVPVPAGVKVNIANATVMIEGPKGKLALAVHQRIAVAQDGDQLVCKRLKEDRLAKSLHGLTRALLANMVVGVTKGFEKKLQIVGVGYNAKLKGKELTLKVGYANEIKLNVPEGVNVVVSDNDTRITVSGPDKQAVGQFAAEIRSVRKPEPYKQTGIRYDGEVVRKKSGKAFGSGG